MATSTAPKTPIDPWGAAASVAGAALSDKTNQTLNNSFSAGFDNSGWAVNVGAGASQTTQTDRSSSALGLAQMLKNPLVLVALVGLAYAFISKHK